MAHPHVTHACMLSSVWPGVDDLDKLGDRLAKVDGVPSFIVAPLRNGKPHEHCRRMRPLRILEGDVVGPGPHLHSRDLLQVLDEVTQLGLDPPHPFGGDLGRLGEDLDVEVVSMLCEKRKRPVDLRPLALRLLHQLHYLVGSAKLRQDDPLRGLSDIVCRVHRREGWRDDRHQMHPVLGVDFRVPHLEPHESWHMRLLLDVAQHDRILPIPPVIDSEEALHERSRSVIWIQLTNTSYQDRPSDPAIEAKDV
mmetsp:Transcript_63902/g.137462  ORF Transcript_63902/g.137462 Transcript_63902/m.137462 type:complete len:251 (-) Transcript_63902:256-1008(-)